MPSFSRFESLIRRSVRARLLLVFGGVFLAVGVAFFLLSGHGGAGGAGEVTDFPPASGAPPDEESGRKAFFSWPVLVVALWSFFIVVGVFVHYLAARFGTGRSGGPGKGSAGRGGGFRPPPPDGGGGSGGPAGPARPAGSLPPLPDEEKHREALREWQKRCREAARREVVTRR